MCFVYFDYSFKLIDVHDVFIAICYWDMMQSVLIA